MKGQLKVSQVHEALEIDLLKRAIENISDHGAVKVDWLRRVIQDIPGHGVVKSDSYQKQ